MPNLNCVHVMGNLTRDPDLRHLQGPNGQFSIGTFGLAINEKQKNGQEKVVFVEVEVTGNVANVVQQYCKKGNPVFVEGKLKFDTWQDQNTGERRSKLLVRARSVQFLANNQQNQQQQWNNQQPTQQPPPQQNQQWNNQQPPQQNQQQQWNNQPPQQNQQWNNQQQQPPQQNQYQQPPPQQNQQNQQNQQWNNQQPPPQGQNWDPGPPPF